MATTARGGAADTSSQQRCLRIGDTILLYVRDRRGYVYSELSGTRHNFVTIYPVPDHPQHDRVAGTDGANSDPGFPNVTLAVFKIIMMNKSKAQQRLAQLQQLRGSSKAVTETELRIAEKEAEMEKRQNLQIQEKNAQRVVLYGDKIQLMHMGSKRYITLSSEHTSRTENNSLLVQLTEDNSVLCVFGILPRFKIRSVGDKVHYGDQIKLESHNTPGQYLHCSNNPLKSVGVSVHSNHYELNLSATESAMTVVAHYSPSSLHHSSAIRGGCCVRLFHCEQECYMVAEGSFAAGHSPVVEDVHCRVRRLDQKSHSKPSTSSNTYWQIEKESDPLSGEILFWKECCRIKHLPTRLYLAVERTDRDDWNVRLKSKQVSEVDPDTLFVFKPHFEEGDEIVAGTYACIQHLVSGRFLHVEDMLYTQTCTPPIKGLSGLQSDSTKLLELTARANRGDYDPFTLQEVEDYHLDNFHYVAGMVPILAKHITSVTNGAQLLMEKEAINVKVALSDLSKWLSRPVSEKEVKNRQKILRNLRVLEQLLEILRITDQQGLLTSRLHVSICQECYNVIQQYLKGDSRKNENYVARFIEFFQSQVGKDLHAENVLVEIVQDNFGIISMMASTQLDSTMAQLYETKNPTFLHFLSSLCVCSGRPIRLTQDQILKRLFQSQVGDLLLRTEVKEEAGSVRVLCSRSDIAAIDVTELQEGQYVFEMLESQILLFARLCEGNNEKAIKQLMLRGGDTHQQHQGFVCLQEALACGSNKHLHPLLRSRYVKLILNMFVKVGKNWSFLDHLSYSFIYEELIECPYQHSAALQSTALTGENNKSFPVLQKWILDFLAENKVVYCDKEHISHNEVFAQVLDVLYHLVNYGYYDSMTDVQEIMAPVIAILTGQEGLREFKEQGTLTDTPENRALFSVTERALCVLEKLLKFNLYVTLQRFMYDFKHSVVNGNDPDGELSFLKQLNPTYMEMADTAGPVDHLQLTRAVRDRLEHISSDIHFPYDQMKTILINISHYKSDQLACLALSILTQIHFFESSLFDQAMSVQLLESTESVAEYKKIASLLPTLRHLLSIDCSVQDQWKIAETLDTFAGMCRLSDADEPHEQNQQLLCNFGVLSDILNYVLARGTQYQMSQQQRKISVHANAGNSTKSGQEGVLKRCIHLLQALCCKNEPVQQQLFRRLNDLLQVDLPLLPLADLITQVFAGAPELCLNVKEEVVDRIFELIVESDDTLCQARLMDSLNALSKIDGVNLPVKRNQALIVKNYCQYSDRLCTQLLGEGEERQAKRWQILTMSDQTDPDLQLLLSFTDLMATCAEGDNPFIDSVCQNLLSVEELIRIISKEELSITRKKPIVRFLIWVYMNTDAGRTSRNTLAHGDTMWAYLNSITDTLISIRSVLQRSTQQSPLNLQTLRASKRRKTHSDTNRPPVATPGGKQHCVSHLPTEEGLLLLAVLEYLTEGIVPLLHAFYTQYFNPIECSEAQNRKELDISAAIASALFSLGMELLKYSCDKTELQQFHETMLTLYGINSIRSMLNEDPEFVIKFMQKMQSRKAFVSQRIHTYHQTYRRQVQLNSYFHSFVKQYEEVYMGPNLAQHQIQSSVPDLFYSDDGEELPLGPKFQALVSCFMSSSEQTESVVQSDGREQRTRSSRQHDGWQMSCSVKPEAELLLKQLEVSLSSEEHLSEADQQQQDMLDIRCLQILRALIHNQIKMIDPELKDRDPVVYRRLCEKLVHPIQAAVQGFGNAVEKVAPLISHHNEAVAREVLSFLKALLFSGNRTVQKGFELFSQSREDKIVLSFRSWLDYAINRYEESSSLKEILKSRGEYMSRQRYVVFKRPVQTVLTAQEPSSQHLAVGIEADDEKPLSKMESPEVHVSVTRKNILFHLGGQDDLPAAADDEDEEEKKVAPFLQPDTSFTLVLEVMGLMCDGQFMSMQDYLREQADNYKSTDMVAAVAGLLQTYSSNISSDNFEIVHKILQTLVEMCVGNATNQLVILDKQVVDAINSLLGIKHAQPQCSHPLTVTRINNCSACKKFTEALTVKGSAVEMLECMLERTSHQTSVVIDGVLGSLDRSALLKAMVYFHEMQSNPLVKTVQMDDDARRGMFRAYHTHVILDENSSTAGKTRETEFEDIELKVMDRCAKQTRCIEVNYSNGDPILTKVYFPHTTNLREEVIEKVKWNINRESMEDKQRALLDLFDPLKRDLKHQLLLRKYFITRVILSFSGQRHILLNLLTLLLCLLVLFSLRIPADDRAFPANPQYDSWYLIVLRLFGSIHILLAMWMVIEYFLTNFPHFRIHVYAYITMRFLLRVAHKIVQAYQNAVSSGGAAPIRKKTNGISIPKRSLLDISLPCLSAIWVLVFLICSVLSIVWYGYFYCICALHIVVNNDILQRVLRAVTKNGIALLWVALLGIIVLFLYSVVSFIFLHQYFYSDDDVDLFCSTLGECFVSLLKYGLLDGIGLAIPLINRTEASTKPMGEPRFEVAAWRLLLDLSFFIVVTTIGLNIVFGIIVDTFSELREERSNIEEDLRSKCFICDLQAHEFDRKAKGFLNHVKHDHNMWDYIYYSMHMDNIDTSDHNAIQKCVFSQIKESKIDFLPQENALCFDPEEDQTGMKLVLIQHRLDTIEQLFKTKEETKQVKAKRNERQQREIKVLRHLQDSVSSQQQQQQHADQPALIDTQ